MTKDKILHDIEKKLDAKIKKRKVTKIFKKIRILGSISEKVIAFSRVITILKNKNEIEVCFPLIENFFPHFFSELCILIGEE